jgi:glutamate carboxypeptidase
MSTDATTGRTLERLRRLVEAESPTGDVQAIERVAELVEAEARAAGGVVKRVAAPGLGAHLVARFPGREGLEPVLILGHMDTVHPIGAFGEHAFVVEGDVARGPGSYDMKAGLAVALEALAELQGEGGARRPVTLLVTCDEEIGSGTSRPLIERLARASVAVLVPEPPLPNGGAKTARKGVGAYELRVHGRAAHAGIEPEKGISATAELAHQILRILDVARPEIGTTLNIGRVQGGSAGNVVAAEAWAEIDARFAVRDEAERVDAALGALTPVIGARLELSGGVNRPPLERTDGVVALYRRAADVAHALGFELPEGGTGGGSDGCFTAAAGVPTLDGIGVRGAGAHTLDEHVLVSDLPRRVALLRGLLESL